MVASTHWLASAAGLAVLEKGGNAFDAAVATGLVLQVVEPHLNGPGGEVPVIGYDAAGDGVFVLDGQGVAPAAATIEAYTRSEEHTSELQSHVNLVCRLLLEKKKKKKKTK